MPFDDRSYVDPFSVSAGNEQMGGVTSSAQIGGFVDTRQQGDNDQDDLSRRGNLTELHRRHSPSQPQAPRPVRQMGSGVVCSQQMG